MSKIREIKQEKLIIASSDLELIIQSLVKEYLITEKKIEELKSEYTSLKQDKHLNLKTLSFLGYKCECLETREEDLYSLIINLRGGKEEIEKQRSNEYLLYK
ncbi:MAG: hypothetical protein KHZ90_08325 [Veillonella parvula]|uniref:Uncharacterized protein n=1 Tax=Veillonella parvula TaxID=29466 RepID=A0A942WNC3_VEIPA|nr:hypothetical protein [Veillonella parvula]MBS4893766.1 hypothetical protein [Veillonella parvula]